MRVLGRVWSSASLRGAVLALAAMALVFALRKEMPASPQLATVVTKAAAVPEVRALTDDELLSLFPNTPVALASLPDGKKRLFFPRPGDEQKFITRL